MLARTTMNDANLAAMLDGLVTLPGCYLHPLVDAFRASVFAKDDTCENWRCVAGGDFAEKALVSIRQLVRKKRVHLSRVESVGEVVGVEWLESNDAPPVDDGLDAPLPWWFGAAFSGRRLMGLQ